MQYPEYVDKIISRLEDAGERAYIVGGSVRDMLLGKTPYDYDVTTSALPEKTAKLFSDMHVITTGLKHGTLTIICDGKGVEVTTFRIDGTYTDARHPDSVRFTRDICADLARRDFTVNAMAYSHRDGLIDIYGGQRDLSGKLIRAVGEPSLRFSEDALRIMRAFRFSAQLGFEIEESTLAGCAQMSNGLGAIARERVGAELIKLICAPYPAKPLMLMADRGVLPYVLSDFCPDERLLGALAQMPDSDVARLGLLLSPLSREKAQEVLCSLRCSSKQITGALAVARGALLTVSTPAEARRLLSLTGIYAPLAARASTLLGNSPEGAYELTVRQQSAPHTLRDLKINGKDISALGVRGKQIGATLEQLLQAVILSPELNERETLLELAQINIKKGSGNNGTA